MKADQSFAKNTSQGVQWVREKQNFVFINDGPINQKIVNQRPCDLTISMYKCVSSILAFLGALYGHYT